MNRLSSIGRSSLRLSLLFGLITLLGLLARLQVALAHPLDLYLQATYITVMKTQE